MRSQGNNSNSNSDSNSNDQEFFDIETSSSLQSAEYGFHGCLVVKPKWENEREFQIPEDWQDINSMYTGKPIMFTFPIFVFFLLKN